MNSMSQEEIDALLNGGTAPSQEEPSLEELAAQTSPEAEFETAEPPTPPNILDDPDTFPDGRRLSSDEKDIIGEIGNICMGSAATTMYTLLNKRVDITTPVVTVLDVNLLASQFEVPFVAVEIAYTEGIEGQNLLLLKDRDAAIITDILMGGNGSVQPPYELNELHLSAISEVMNQMAGASATALSNILQMPTNISPPSAKIVSNETDTVSETIRNDAPLIKTSFVMEIEDVLSSSIMQIMPYSFCKTLASKLLSEQQDDTESLQATPPAPPAQEAAPPVAPAAQIQAPPPNAPAPQQQYAQPAAPQAYQSVQYPAFDDIAPGAPSPYSSEAIGRIVDVPLQVNVILGNSKKSIKEILEFSIGTVIMLDKVAGDPVDVMVNGKLIAKGEVVVIDDNYGVRITEVLSSKI